MTVLALLVLGCLGLLAGGLANYTAQSLLRAEDPFSGDSAQKECLHKLSFFEAIPLYSFFCPSRQCQYCQRRLFFEYPLVEIVTAAAFLVIAWRFQLNAYSIGIMIFVTVLIAVCITDFKAKIIPHEITYPSILLGIIFSAQIRSDALGALAGIGASYIIFDFLAFYGLHFYLWLNPPSAEPSRRFLSIDKKNLVPKWGAPSFWFSQNVSQIPTSLSKSIKHYTSGLYCKGVPLEELEVIGGGDAVLAALISAWLGWRKLVVSLIVSFLVGAILGALYLLVELWRQRLMRVLIIPVSVSVFVASLLTISILALVAYWLHQPAVTMPYLSVLPWSILAGSLLGTIIAGSRMSKPFPFGPALAVGAIVAIFT